MHYEQDKTTSDREGLTHEQCRHGYHANPTRAYISVAKNLSGPSHPSQQMAAGISRSNILIWFLTSDSREQVHSSKILSQHIYLHLLIEVINLFLRSHICTKEERLQQFKENLYIMTPHIVCLFSG